MKPRASSSHRLFAPPLVYAGEREALLAEQAEVRAAIERFKGSPRLQWPWVRRLIKINARLLDIERAPVVPPVTRADLQ